MTAKQAGGRARSARLNRGSGGGGGVWNPGGTSLHSWGLAPLLASAQSLGLRRLPRLTLHRFSPPTNNLSHTFNQEHPKFPHRRFRVVARENEAV